MIVFQVLWFNSNAWRLEMDGCVAFPLLYELSAVVRFKLKIICWIYWWMCCGEASVIIENYFPIYINTQRVCTSIRVFFYLKQLLKADTKPFAHESFKTKQNTNCRNGTSINNTSFPQPSIKACKLKHYSLCHQTLTPILKLQISLSKYSGKSRESLVADKRIRDCTLVRFM